MLLKKEYLQIQHNKDFLKLKNDKSILEEKIAIKKAHSLKSFENKNIVNFLKNYASKDFDSVRDRNDFLNNFISRVNLYDIKLQLFIIQA